MKPIIEVKNLSKKYTIGETQSYETLRDILMEYARKPFAFLSAEKTGGTKAGKSDFWALKDVSFEIKPGEVVGIVGRNGAGKSTLLKILSRITPPTEGEIVLRGRVASLLEVGTGFNAELTGRENIFLNGAILGMKQEEIRRKFDDIVNFSETGKFLDTPVKYYSSGMYMRLAFAVAAHMEPDILLVDEVLAVGDAEFQKKCLGKMESVAKQGRTVIFISHNMSMIKLLCSRSLLIEAGKMVAQGSTDTIIRTYLSSNKTAGNRKINLMNVARAYLRKPVISAAWMEDENGNIVSEIPMGMGIKIFYSFRSDKKIINPGFGCIIHTIYGQQISSFTSYLISKKRYQSVSEGRVVFYIPQLPLLPGTYLVSFGLSEGKSNAVDQVENALRMTVTENDYFLTGLPYDNSHGTIFLKGEIDLRTRS